MGSCVASHGLLRLLAFSLSGFPDRVTWLTTHRRFSSATCAMLGLEFRSFALVHLFYFVFVVSCFSFLIATKVGPGVGP